MDHRWSQRLLLWWERTEHSLKKRWWLWPLLYLIEDFWHMVHASTSEYLRDHGAAVIADLLAHVPSDPMTLAVITGVLIIVSLAVHAYFDSRKALKTGTPAQGWESDQALPSGAELRDRAELLEQISKRDRDIHDLNRTLGNRVAEIENMKDAQTNLEAAVERLWRLKEDAREIRRLWPDADFNKRPAFRTSWIPSAGTDEPWLEKGLAWHQAMFVAPIYPALSHHHLSSLDFDELMEFLDNAERLFRKKTVRALQINDGEAPVIRLMNWVPGEGGTYSCGFMMLNDGRPASDIDLKPVNLVTNGLEADRFGATLLKDHGPTMLKTSIVDLVNGYRRREGKLAHGDKLAALISAMPHNSNGMVLPIPLRVTFRDGDGKRYVSRHEMSAHGNSVTVVYVNTERLSID